jgi:hypothetical protein
MVHIIETYKKIKESIPELLDVSGYRNDFIAKKMNMKPSYFSIKKQRGNWTEKDIQKILSILTSHNTDVEKFLDSILIGKSFPGDTMTSAEFEKQMKW